MDKNDQTPERPRGPRPEEDAEKPPRRSSSRPTADDAAGALLALNRRQPPRPDARPPQEPNAPDAVGAPDALDSDRILELPPRRAIVRPDDAPAGAREDEHAPLPLRPPARIVPSNRLRAVPPARLRPVPDSQAAPKPMASLREAAQPYLARLAAKRPPEPRGDAEKSPVRKRPSAPAEPPACPRCGGAGYVRLDVPVGDPAFGKAVLCECREREIEERERKKLRDLSSLRPFDKKTFDTFDAALPGVREAHEVAGRYAEDPQGWLVLQGGYGCGKTHLAAAIAHRREDAGDTVFFSIVPDLLDHLRAAFAPTSEMTYDALFDRIREAGLLVLDDLGSENATAWATEKLFQIINYRYNYRMPTVITTNKTLLSHMDDRIRSRLSDRGLVRWVVIEAPDFRERHLGPGGRPPRGNGGSGGAGRGRGYSR